MITVDVMAPLWQRHSLEFSYETKTIVAEHVSFVETQFYWFSQGHGKRKSYYTMWLDFVRFLSKRFYAHEDFRETCDSWVPLNLYLEGVLSFFRMHLPQQDMEHWWWSVNYSQNSIYLAKFWITPPKKYSHPDSETADKLAKETFVWGQWSCYNHS